MTTNHPEKLDKALIRPGRVDHQVAFRNATQNQVKELFERMYTHDVSRTTRTPSPSSSSPPSYSSTLSTAIILSSNKRSPTENGNLLTPPPTPPNETTANGVANSGKRGNAKLNEEELIDIARKFAAQVPDDMFSPAEIQGFLLKRKMEPRRAMEEVGPWVEEMKSVKMKGESEEESVSDLEESEAAEASVDVDVDVDGEEVKGVGNESYLHFWFDDDCIGEVVR
jgi:chaperone BCS1